MVVGIGGTGLLATAFGRIGSHISSVRWAGTSVILGFRAKKDGRGLLKSGGLSAPGRKFKRIDGGDLCIYIYMTVESSKRILLEFMFSSYVLSVDSMALANGWKLHPPIRR